MSSRSLKAPGKTCEKERELQNLLRSASRAFSHRKPGFRIKNSGNGRDNRFRKGHGNHVMQMIAPTRKRICPRCGSGQIMKSHMRGTIERFMHFPVRLQAYRCCDCDKRFYGHPGRKVSVGGTLSRDNPR
jgi:ribosomal protein S27AE